MGEYPIRIPQHLTTYLALKGLPVKFVAPSEGSPTSSSTQPSLRMLRIQTPQSCSSIIILTRNLNWLWRRGPRPGDYGCGRACGSCRDRCPNFETAWDKSPRKPGPNARARKANLQVTTSKQSDKLMANQVELKADVLVVGGGLGGVSATLTAASLGATVILVEELDWLGGQLTAQGIPLDESPWNETVIFSRTYTEFRNRIRQYYRDHYPLTAEARANPLLNPGMGNVSTIAHEPRVSVQVIAAMLSPYVGAGTLRVLQRHKVLSVVSHGDRISGLIAINLNSGREIAITCGNHRRNRDWRHTGAREGRARVGG